MTVNRSKRPYQIHVVIATLFVFLFCSEGTCQSDDQSNSIYKAIYTQKQWEVLDPDGDKKFSEEDDERRWRWNKKFDLNNDKIVTYQEFENTIEVPYLNTGGKRKLNVLYKTTNEEDLYLDMYYPKNSKETDKLPVVIYTHGGGWVSGSRHGAANAYFKTVHTALLEKGFCVVSVSYRLVAQQKSITTSMRDCVIDSKDAIRYLSKHSKELGIDTNKVYSFGDSAGGQISQMLLLSPPNSLLGDKSLSKYSYTMVAGVSWYGPCDFENTSLFNYDDRANFHDRFGGRILKPDTESKDTLALYREMSPLNYLNKNSAPLLLIQGDSDTTIPVKHAYYMQEKNRAINAPVTIKIVKNAGHNWRKVGADISPTKDEIVQTTVDYFVSHK